MDGNGLDISVARAGRSLTRRRNRHLDRLVGKIDESRDRQSTRTVSGLGPHDFRHVYPGHGADEGDGIGDGVGFAVSGLPVHLRHREVVREEQGLHGAFDRHRTCSRGIVGDRLRGAVAGQQRIDTQTVRAGLRLDTERLNLLHRRHVEADERVVRQGCSVGVRVGGVIDTERIGAAARDREQTCDLVHKVCITPHVNGVLHRGVSGVDGGVS